TAAWSFARVGSSPRTRPRSAARCEPWPARSAACGTLAARDAPGDEPPPSAVDQGCFLVRVVLWVEECNHQPGGTATPGTRLSAPDAPSRSSCARPGR